MVNRQKHGKSPSPQFRALLRRQLDEKLGMKALLREVERPKKGWIHTLRTALGMSAAQLASRLGMSRQGIVNLEKGETLDTISLGTLRRVADGLGADLVVALVPRTSLDDIVTIRAREKATHERNRLVHTMRLEDQDRGVEQILDVEKATNEWITGRITKLWDSETDA